MSGVEDELRSQMIAAFEGADYPVENQMALVPVLPDGPSTTFAADDVEVTAMELATKLSSYQDFPYENVESMVDDVIEGMRAEGML